jgi:uncharacterized membrane protein
MTSLVKGFVRGTAAGAAGTTALNATTYADMALRGRAASGMPVSAIRKFEKETGWRVPGRDGQRKNRLHGLGPLSGNLTGVVVGGLAGALRSTGLRLPTVIGGPLLGAAAMLATDLPATRLRLTDPAKWSTADWVADAVPHLVYGVTTHATLVAASRGEEQEQRRARAARLAACPRAARSKMTWRAAAIGAASGCRTSAGLLAVSWTSKRADRGAARVLAGPAPRLGSALMAAGEFTWDKYPSIPDRTGPQGLPGRLAFGAAAAAATAQRDKVQPVLPALIGSAAAAGSTFAGYRLRALAAERFGSDRPGALIEDAVALTLGFLGARRP